LKDVIEHFPGTNKPKQRCIAFEIETVSNQIFKNQKEQKGIL
jgi:hypothetical protein